MSEIPVKIEEKSPAEAKVERKSRKYISGAANLVKARAKRQEVALEKLKARIAEKEKKLKPVRDALPEEVEEEPPALAVPEPTTLDSESESEGEIEEMELVPVKKPRAKPKPKAEAKRKPKPKPEPEPEYEPEPEPKPEPKPKVKRITKAEKQQMTTEQMAALIEAHMQKTVKPRAKKAPAAPPPTPEPAKPRFSMISL